jgi:guanylate kinase
MSEHATTASNATQTGRMVVISGPSGSGKTTVCGRLLKDPDVVMSVSTTTRPPRPREEGGVNYHFVSRDEFAELVERGEFAEHAEYNGNLYGTPKAALESILAGGKTALVEIDVQGAAQLGEVYPDALYIFLDAPDRDAARARLERRNTETAEERAKRIEAAEQERASADKYFDHHVINDDLDETVECIRKLIGSAARMGGSAAQTTR